jgi:hypothetical protein
MADVTPIDVRDSQGFYKKNMMIRTLYSVSIQ